MGVWVSDFRHQEQLTGCRLWYVLNRVDGWLLSLVLFWRLLLVLAPTFQPVGSGFTCRRRLRRLTPYYFYVELFERWHSLLGSGATKKTHKDTDNFVL
jgi:hypothetical protein